MNDIFSSFFAATSSHSIELENESETGEWEELYSIQKCGFTKKARSMNQILKI